MLSTSENMYFEVPFLSGIPVNPEYILHTQDRPCTTALGTSATLKLGDGGRINVTRQMLKDAFENGAL